MMHASHDSAAASGRQELHEDVQITRLQSKLCRGSLTKGCIRPFILLGDEYQQYQVDQQARECG